MTWLPAWLCKHRHRKWMRKRDRTILSSSMYSINNTHNIFIGVVIKSLDFHSECEHRLIPKQKNHVGKNNRVCIAISIWVVNHKTFSICKLQMIFYVLLANTFLCNVRLQLMSSNKKRSSRTFFCLSYFFSCICICLFGKSQM